MNIKINDVMYEDVQWSGNTLTLPSTMTLEEVDAAFKPGDTTDVISVYEGEEETQRYYNRGINAIRMTQYGDAPRQIEIEFNASQINRPVEQTLQENVDDQAGAILDLAELFADFERYKVRWNSMADVIDAHARILQEHVETLDELMSMNGPLVLLEERLNDLASRVPQTESEEEMNNIEHEYVPTSADAGTLGTHDEEGNKINTDEPIEAESEVSSDEEVTE